MRIGGFQESSLLDYPGKIAAIIWTTGCNFRCPFCYNPDLVFDRTEHMTEDQVLSFLQTRIGKLDAVSISGGEPFLQKDLSSFITSVKNLGFLVKVDTNGTYPRVLKELLDKGLVDYVSMDVKSDKSHYADLAGISVDIGKIDRSIHLIMDNAKDYEFKTTVIPQYHNEASIRNIGEWLQGAKRYYLQQFKVDTTLLSESLSSVKPYKKSVLQGFCEQIKPFFKECHVRGI